MLNSTTRFQWVKVLQCRYEVYVGIERYDFPKIVHCYQEKPHLLRLYFGMVQKLELY